MYTFRDLLKRIRLEAGLTQEELSKILRVSTVLIAMVETGQKEVSRNLIERLARRLEVHPSSITPFVFIDKNVDLNKLPKMEKTLIKFGERMQKYLIHQRSQNLKKYAQNKSLSSHKS